MKTNNKKGISLIVLVITIIVMIILAAAIILSLNNSGVIDKANKAKRDSDTANLKEYVSVLEAEYELMTTAERNGKTSTQYVNEKLEEKGYKQALLMEDGTLYTNLQENSKAVLKAGIEVGDVVVGYNTYLTSKTAETSGMEQSSDGVTPAAKQTVQNMTDLEWKFIGISDEGKIEIMPGTPRGSGLYWTDSSSYFFCSGPGGFLFGPTVVNKVAYDLYSTDKGTARSITRDDIVEILGYTGEKGAYHVTYIPTPEAKTIGELEKELNITVPYRRTPDNKVAFEDYKSDYYKIIHDSTEMKYPDRFTSLIAGWYYTADSCVWLSRYNSEWVAMYIMCTVDGGCVGGNINYSSKPGLYDQTSGGRNGGVKPIVALNSDVTITKDASAENTWNI